MKRGILSLAVVLLLAPPCFAQYTFTTLDYPGGVETRLIGANDQFDIVGAYRVPGGVRHAMLFSKGRFTPLDPDGILGSNLSGALQINNRGDIVGYYAIGSQRHGFLLRDGIVTTVDYPGSSYTQVNGISDTGVMIGQFRDASGHYHGYVLRDGTFEQLDYPGALDTFPYYMNARGDIAGEWDPNLAVLGHGFLLKKDGEWFSFDVPGARADSTFAIGVNDHEQILGLYTEPSGHNRGFIVDGRDIRLGAFTLFDLPGVSGVPETMNNAGEFVGYYSDGRVIHGFVATPIPGRDR